MTSYPSNHKEWLAKLISYDTTSRNSNLELITYVEDYLKSVGITSTRVYMPDTRKANLFATIPADDGTTQGGIVFSGHTDVVPVDGQKWDSDPFQMTEKDGKLYGRGTCDVKGYLAVVLALTPTFLSMKRAKPIHYAFSCDEEIGCFGAVVLVAHLKKQGFKADCCLVGEPTGMKVYVGSKGFAAWKITVHGKAIHSSMALMNTSCNAIEYAAQIITRIREIAEDIKVNGKHDANYLCPFSPITTGLVKGGNAVNTVPAECEFVFSIRVTDTQIAKDLEEQVKQYIDSVILPAMRTEYADATVDIQNEVMMPAFNAENEHPFTHLMRRLCHDTPTIRKKAGGQESGFFQEQLGIPTVNVGPGFGVSHMPNEYVPIADMEACAVLLKELALAITSGGEDWKKTGHL